MPQKLLNCHANIFDDLPQKNWGHISTGMVWDGGGTPVRVAILHV